MAHQSEVSVEQARTMLKEVKLRCTTCRIALLQRLATMEQPASHAELADLLTPEGFDKSTIYRCLIELSDAGLLNRLELGDHVWRFELKRDHDFTDHPHFMCVDCGKVACLTDVTVRVSGKRGKSAKVPDMAQVTEIMLKGHCAECQ